jgi:alkanesulfonate monooxygenase SsuD/methylene tetrahydromethanopterin reductase-like flavin-dependent oxidoreductase (luciferase family)
MRIGVLQTASSLSAAAPGDALRRFTRVSIEAERLGYFSTWTTHHKYGSSPSYRPNEVSVEDYPDTDYDMATDPLTLLAYVAAQTKRIRLGTAVVILHWEHPLNVAERAAMVDALSGGRLEFGVGRGAGFRETEVFEVPLDGDVNNRKFQEMVDIIRAAWSGEPFRHEGEFFRFPELILRPRPVQQPAPLLIATTGVESTRWAAERGIPYATITWTLADADEYRQKRIAYKTAADAAGFDPSSMPLPHVILFYCGESDAEAEDTAYRYLITYQHILEHHYEWQRDHPKQPARLAAGPQAWELIEAMARLPIEQHIIGGPDTCRERMEFWRDEIGVDYVVLNTGFGLMPEELTVASLRRFATHVMPQFTEKKRRVHAAL